MSKRRQITPEVKMSILRAHLVEGVPVSDLCDEHKIYATQYYDWQKQIFENGQVCFLRKKNAASLKFC